MLKDIELHFLLLNFVIKSILHAKIDLSQKVCFKTKFSDMTFLDKMQFFQRNGVYHL